MTKLKQLFSIEWIKKIILWYLLAQPVLDIATSFLVRSGIDLTIGVVFRALFLGFLGLYLLFFYRGPKRKLVVGYIAAVIAFVVVQTVFLFAKGGMAVLFTNLKETIKVFYFPCILVAFWALYREFGYLVSTRTLVSIGVFYTLTIFISFLTDTSFQSYNGNGYCGWFYAANEISAITIILSPIVFYYFTNRAAYTNLLQSPWKKRLPLVLTGAISVLLMLFASSYLATKAALFGVVAYLLCFLIWSVFRLEITRDKLHLFRLIASLLMVVSLGVIFFLSSPIKEHLTVRLPWFHYVVVQTGVTQPPPVTTTEPPATTTEPPAATTAPPATTQAFIPVVPDTSSKLYRIANWLLSSRLSNSYSVLLQYTESDLGHKLLGLGYTQLPSYRYYVTIAIEMDFICVLARHGLVGLFLFSAPFFAILACALWRAIKALKGCLASLLWCTCLYQTLISFAVGFLVGHTLIAPAVSIYAICSLMRLLAETERICTERKKLPSKQ